MPFGQVLFEHYAEHIKVDHIRRSAVYVMSPHMHSDRYEIYYLLSGSRDYLIRDTIYSVSKGQLMLIPAGELHKTLESGRPEHERIVVEFDPSLIAEELDRLPDLPLMSVFRSRDFVVQLPADRRRQVEKLLFDLIRELREEAPGYQAMVRCSLLQLLIILYRGSDHRSSEDTLAQHGHQAWITSITRHIHDHYGAELSLTALARQFTVSPYYLSRCFKKETGMNLPDYINLIRVKEAKHRLLQGESRITDIALSVGFSNITHFGRVFRKVYGVSPSDLRRSIRISHGENP